MDDPALGEKDLPPSFIGLLDVVSGRARIDPRLKERLDAVRELLDEPDDTPRPFLSVLLRTQGKRLEAFKDALLCMSAQSDEDFELIILEHNASEADAANVRRIVERMPRPFADRIQLLEISGGTRAKPLNVGVEAAVGQYLAVFDDDDLAMGNWVEAFHTVARASSPGRMLRAVVANQSVSIEPWPHGQAGFRTTSWPNAEYPDSFDLLQHLLVNYSPFMSWAFPRALFFTYGVRFDEELTVCEDWDVILRGSLLCGVDDVPELTAIYRRWTVGESSYSIHSTQSWRESEQRVIDRIDDHVIMMPPGAMQAMRRMVLYNTALDNYRFIFDGTSLRRPLNHIWDLTRPGFKLAVRARNFGRRIRRRS
jgi:hypothetical protein